MWLKSIRVFFSQALEEENLSLYWAYEGEIWTLKLLAAIFQFQIEKLCLNTKAKENLSGVRDGGEGRVHA